MSVSDAQIGKNLARMRGDLSQADLAEKMRELGYKWSQATVWAVEKGERPIRLTEAEDVARILGTYSGRLTASDAISQIEAAKGAVYQAHKVLQKAISDYHEAQLQLMAIAQDSPVDIEGTPMGHMVLDWLQTTAADVEREIRVEETTKNQAENAKWAYLIGKRNGETTQEVMESMDAGAEIMQGVFVDAWRKPWEELDDLNLVPAPANVTPLRKDDATEDRESVPDDVETEWEGRYAAHPIEDWPEDHTP